MNDLDLNNYTIYTLRDCNENENIYGVIMLHNSHTADDFQKEINRIKEEFEDEIHQYGDDWQIISREISDDFDWLELRTSEEYLEY